MEDLAADGLFLFDNGILVIKTAILSMYVKPIQYCRNKIKKKLKEEKPQQFYHLYNTWMDSREYDGLF